MRKENGKARGDESGIEATFAGYPPPLRRKLRSLRRLILNTAHKTDGVGPLQETLKWGQPSYLPAQSGSGTTVRIDGVRGAPDCYAMFFHCQTDLVATFREIYPNELTYEGNRSILFNLDETIDEAALSHCIALALTYHQRKSSGRSPGTKKGRAASSSARRKTS
jgi:hypothetical protein